mgnify:CR=1 FL=1
MSVTNYEKICRIGEGTYGIVYKARNRHTGDLVFLMMSRRCGRWGGGTQTHSDGCWERWVSGDMSPWIKDLEKHGSSERCQTQRSGDWVIARQVTLDMFSDDIIALQCVLGVWVLRSWLFKTHHAISTQPDIYDLADQVHPATGESCLSGWSWVRLDFGLVAVGFGISAWAIDCPQRYQALQFAVQQRWPCQALRFWIGTLRPVWPSKAVTDSEHS